MGGVFIDYASPPTSWADAIGRHPWIEDRDGTAFRNLPALRFKQSLDPVEDNTNTGPAISDSRRSPAAAMPDRRQEQAVAGTPAHNGLRMVGNGENCPEGDCGQPAGTVCTFALCPGKPISSFHDNPNSPEAQDDHA